MIHVAGEEKEVCVKTSVTNPMTDHLELAGDYELVKASVSFDMWSYGCVLFHLCSGKPLFLADNDDNLGDVDLERLAGWQTT